MQNLGGEVTLLCWVSTTATMLATCNSRANFWRGELGKENRGCVCKMKLSCTSHLLVTMLYLESQNCNNAVGLSATHAGLVSLQLWLRHVTFAQQPQQTKHKRNRKLPQETYNFQNKKPYGPDKHLCPKMSERGGQLGKYNCDCSCNMKLSCNNHFLVAM